MLKAVFTLFAAALLTACATSTNLLNEGEIASMRIERVEVKFKEDASISWYKVEQEFVEREMAKRTAKGGALRAKAKSVPDAHDKAPDAMSIEAQTIAASPEAKAYVREALARLIKLRLEKDVVPEFKGARPVVLEIQVVGFVIPSAAQRLVLGGTPILAALRTLKDAKSGAELAKLDRGSAAAAGQGILGVAIEQALPDLEERLLDSFTRQTRDWLNKK